MNNSRQKTNFEEFKNILEAIVASESQKLTGLQQVKSQLNDKNLTAYLTKRESFLNFCQKAFADLKPREYSTEIEPFFAKYQKEYYLQIDTLKKEGLKLTAVSQKPWFEKLYQNNFDSIKVLLRNLLINETQAEKVTMERVIQEIELVRFKGR